MSEGEALHQLKGRIVPATFEWAPSPPDTSHGHVVARAQRWGVLRAPAAAAATVLALTWLTPASSSDVHVVAGGIFVAIWWTATLWLTIAQRDVILTSSHLIVTQRDAPRRWGRLDDMQSVLISPSVPVPELSKTSGWFTITVHPQEVINPPQPGGPFATVLLGPRASMRATRTLQERLRGRVDIR